MVPDSFQVCHGAICCNLITPYDIGSAWDAITKDIWFQPHYDSVSV